MVHIVKMSVELMYMEFLSKEDVAEAVVRALGEKKGLDVSEMTGVDFAAFKETRYGSSGF